VAIALCALTVIAGPRALHAQAPLAGGLPGGWIEANGFAQRVSNDFGDWRGIYLRSVRPSRVDTWYVEGMALEAFGQRGGQVGATHRHDWSQHLFHVLGATVGSGAAILPRVRTDGMLGVRFGSRNEWQATAGGSYVKSTTSLYDVAATTSLAWYAPRALVLEAAARFNDSRPGNIASHRLFGVAILTPSPRRSISLRAGGGTEGWQIVSATTTLRRFASQDYSLAWREKLSAHWALSVQGDHYTNPYYTRTGATLGAARYW
jgi:YaiO family outer membrane protein